MVRILKAMTDFDAVTAFVCFSSEARKPGVKEKSTEMAFNGSGVRDTARVLKVGINTVIRTLKKIAPKRVTSSPVAHADVALICELDEQWLRWQ